MEIDTRNTEDSFTATMTTLVLTTIKYVLLISDSVY